MPIFGGDCSVCDGTGDCPECKGGGYGGLLDQFIAGNVAPLFGASKEDVEEMEQCDRCHGSTKCDHCGGTGEEPDED